LPTHFVYSSSFNVIKDSDIFRDGVKIAHWK
jgi:hypothetical protein